MKASRCLLSDAEQRRRISLRLRAATLPDPTMPFHDAPPLEVTGTEELADIAPIRAERFMLSGPILGASVPATDQDPRRVARDFCRWRAARSPMPRRQSPQVLAGSS